MSNPYFRCNECHCIIDVSELNMACPDCGRWNDYETVVEDEDEESDIDALARTHAFAPCIFGVKFK